MILFITIMGTQYNQKNQSHAEEGMITVYKSLTCGCCKKWILHLEENGFKVKAINTSIMSRIKEEKGIPEGARSCHTAMINNYVIEGHVPVADIQKLLTEKRNIAGITVPGMPMGSLGMEGAGVGHYSVYEFDKNGTVKEINQY
jgi:hypothetical protein